MRKHVASRAKDKSVGREDPNTLRDDPRLRANLPGVLEYAAREFHFGFDRRVTGATGSDVVAARPAVLSLSTSIRAQPLWNAPIEFTDASSEAGKPRRLRQVRK